MQIIFFKKPRNIVNLGNHFLNLLTNYKYAKISFLDALLHRESGKTSTYTKPASTGE